MLYASTVANTNALWSRDKPSPALFSITLPDLVSDWYKRVEVEIGYDLSQSMECPECGKDCPHYDHREMREWRHLDTEQFIRKGALFRLIRSVLGREVSRPHTKPLRSVLSLHKIPEQARAIVAAERMEAERHKRLKAYCGYGVYIEKS